LPILFGRALTISSRNINPLPSGGAGTRKREAVCATTNKSIQNIIQTDLIEQIYDTLNKSL
jgi:hypothetical protein